MKRSEIRGRFVSSPRASASCASAPAAGQLLQRGFDGREQPLRLPDMSCHLVWAHEDAGFGLEHDTISGARVSARRHIGPLTGVQVRAPTQCKGVGPSVAEIDGWVPGGQLNWIVLITFKSCRFVF